MKLTPARIEMLEQLELEPGYYAGYYPPLKWALHMGYAEEFRGRFQITDIGRGVLSSSSRAKRGGSCTPLKKEGV